MINKFCISWGTIRAVVILLVVGCLIYLGFCNTAHAFTIDGLHYNGPDSEIERTERAAREKSNKEAYDRDRGDAPNRSDRQREADSKKADQWERDHSA